MAQHLKKFLLAALGAAMISAAAPAQAQPELKGNFGDWSTYVRSQDGEKICYVLSRPKSMSPKNVNHGDVFFMVANWNSGLATEQPSFQAGYSLKPETPPKVSVGSDRYTMYVSQNEGFIQENSDETSLVKSMRRGSLMRVNAMSMRGTAVAYSFSLNGITAALNKSRDLCK